jgi:hypothetical protein
VDVVNAAADKVDVPILEPINELLYSTFATIELPVILE